MFGEILKAGVQKEYGAAPHVALWDSWIYRSWKSDRSMMKPLAENWKHLVGIFRKFSLRWWKRCQLRSWIAFGERYQSSSHITQKTWIKVRYISHINQDLGVDTQQVYKWYGNDRDGYICWYSQRRGSIMMLKDCYLANFLWREWDAGSSLLFWKWYQQYQAWAREGKPNYAMDNFPQFFCPQDPSKTE